MKFVDQGANGAGLGNRALLDKVDRLRELGVSATIPLPQIVVAGQQSAGKSSLLESLTGISFPRSVSLCTRFATEIICRREVETSIVVTIQPAQGSSAAQIEAARNFHRTVSSFTGDEFAVVYKDATAAMGLRAEGDATSNAPTFTTAVLRIESCGPEEEHLTLIDIPGLFDNVTPGVTTNADIALVKEMVKSYIKDSRTIILAVVPCNADIANQAIIRLASEVDPEGQRTLGVLTKPDLAAAEMATMQAAADLVRGRRRDLKLGYCIVRNRGADDNSVTLDMEARNAQEREFFSSSPWNTLDPTRIGIPALRSRLRTLLMDRTKTEFPNVKRDMLQQLKDAQLMLAGMGEARSTRSEQLAYLCKVARHFSGLVDYGRNAYYAGDPVFSRKEDLRLITRARELNESFAHTFFKSGHYIDFDAANSQKLSKEEQDRLERVLNELNLAEDSDGSTTDADESSLEPIESFIAERDAGYPVSFKIPINSQYDLHEILEEPFSCTKPLSRALLKEIEGMYHKYRGYELGTFGNSVIPAMFKMQAQKWEALTLNHMSNAVLIVHHFILAVIEEACPDPTVRDPLWALLLEELIPCYRRAMEHAKFLLSVELNGPAVTCNPAFQISMENSRQARLTHAAKKHTVEVPRGVKGVQEGNYINVDDLAKCTDANTTSEVVLRIHDVTKSYYEVARTRFVDNICAHAVDHFLLSAEDGPLKVFNSEFVTRMTDEDLDTVAGEDTVSRNQRVLLKQQMELLEKAVKILRS
ncbi:P-loop containing nucleoside triphosphate hydrolase protein [Immersiella caudata]|uniref:P-loop containing nucleoside triphosphate hydrolase protein n=1 Tax=Immersiella caudata TaxID=314043 RepID=A0AA40BWN3_9PEZI|nr:P-loop containing nucleoside triphosphate hydrolase protein [Immersiella caudata]